MHVFLLTGGSVFVLGVLGAGSRLRHFEELYQRSGDGNKDYMEDEVGWVLVIIVSMLAAIGCFLAAFLA